MYPIMEVLLIFSLFIHHGYSSECRELNPMKGFSSDMLQGKYYWIIQKIAYRNQNNNNKCYYTYSFRDNKTWTFIEMSTTTNGNQTFFKEVGNMDRPGHWTVSSTFPNGQPFKYSMTAIGGKPKTWCLLYSCNPRTGSYALWLLYYKRISANQIDSNTHKGVTNALKSNNITAFGSESVKNDNCTCY